MILTLEVTGPQASSLPARRKVFGIEGGSIGRLPDNDWVLADPYVSGRHAIIRFMDGGFYIEDTSRNGVFVNSTEERIVRGRPHLLASGDRILIDPYEIEAQISNESIEAPASSLPAANPFQSIESSFPNASISPVPADPLQGLGLRSDKPQAPKGPSGSELAGGSPLWSHYAPPVAKSDAPPSRAPELIPDNWADSSVSIAPAVANPLRSSPALPARPAPQVPAPPSRDIPAAPDHAGLEALLRAVGVEGPVSPELANDLGEIFRVVVSGVMDVLKARQQTKDQFGLGMTTFKRADNNPLKFSASVDDALHNLFVRRENTPYLNPVEAFEDAFEDMRNHQIAMLVGVRVAFEAMLSEFHPDHLQEQFDRQVKKGALVSMPARLRYWELYREWIHDMVRDADTSFRELFGDEFARAYEEQLKRLKAQGRSGKG
jgi:type VI secretion system FHA domain protein